MSEACQIVRLDPEQLRQLARLVAVETARHGKPAEQLPEHILPKQAIEYTGWGRTLVFEFMRREPLACVLDAQGQRRVSRRWLDAAAAGEHALAALRRVSA